MAKYTTFIADEFNGRIQKFDPNGTFITAFGWGSGTGDGQFDHMEKLAIDSSGNVYVADEFNHRVQKFAPVALPLGRAWSVAGVGDFNRDGRADILWRHNRTGKTYLWFMNRTRVIAQGPTSRQFSRAWGVAGVGDFSRDRRADVLWRYNRTGRTYMWLMNRTRVIGRGWTRP